jgi:hypothetical protein
LCKSQGRPLSHNLSAHAIFPGKISRQEGYKAAQFNFTPDAVMMKSIISEALTPCVSEVYRDRAART